MGRHWRRFFDSSPIPISYSAPMDGCHGSWTGSPYRISTRTRGDTGWRTSRSTTCGTASKSSIDAYDGTTHVLRLRRQDPIIAAYRRMFPTLFKDASAMPAGLRAHVRYPELLLALQAEVYSLYHMTDPQVFYNREDLWTVATDVSADVQRIRAAQPMEPELPFDAASRRARDGICRDPAVHAGKPEQPDRLDCRPQRWRTLRDAIAYDFPKTSLVDGPLQVEARSIRTLSYRAS